VEMALARNTGVRITDAPAVSVRPRPAPAILLDAAYPEQPVLWRARATPVTLVFENPGERPIRGEWALELPAHLHCAAARGALSLAPRERAEITTAVWHTGEVLWDRNLLTLRWSGADGATASHAFGLCGARQWTVYGPYWETWDVTRDATDPYLTPAGANSPIFVPDHVGDSWNHYARLEHPYLDEARLLREDIPDELPARVELGEDFFTGADLAGFRGQACFYLVRRLVAAEPMQISFHFSSSAPAAIWLDGAEIFRRETPREVSPHDQALGPFDFGPEPKRLVIKLARQTDHLAGCLLPITNTFIRPGGRSWLSDELGEAAGGACPDDIGEVAPAGRES